MGIISAGLDGITHFTMFDGASQLLSDSCEKAADPMRGFRRLLLESGSESVYQVWLWSDEEMGDLGLRSRWR